MTIFRGTVLDTPRRPVHRRPAARRGRLRPRRRRRGRRRPRAVRPSARRGRRQCVDLRGGLLLPGLVDTHVHFPQVRVIGGLGMPLLDWLEECALPEEARLAAPTTPPRWPRSSSTGWCGPGRRPRWCSVRTSRPRSTALRASATVGLRVTAGLVVATGSCARTCSPRPSGPTPRRLALAARWHGKDRLRYAVTPRFSLSTRRRDAGGVRGGAPRRPRRSVHLPHQRERRRDRHRARALPGARALHRHLRPARAARAAQRARAQRASRRRTSSTCWPSGHGRRALPDEQHRAGQRSVPAAPTRRAPACGWRWAPTSAPAPASRC